MAQEKMSLTTYLAKVRDENLDLKSETAKAQSAEAKSIGLALPPPMVGINQMKEDSGITANGFEVNQTIPFPTKLTSDHSARKYAAQSQNEGRLAKEAEIMASARRMFYGLWALQQKVLYISEKKSVLQNHIKLSRSSARSDSFAGVHVLKTESDLDLLENESLDAEQKLAEKQAELAAFINSDPATFKIVAQEPPLPKIPKVASTEDSHQIQSMKFNLENTQARESEAKSSWFPDLSIRYKELGATSMASRYNEIMVGVTLPFVFFWEPHAASKSASAERAQAEFELQKQKRSVESDKITLSKKVETLQKQLDLLNQKLIPRAEKRMKLVHNLAPRDMETLQDHRETMEALPDLKLKALEIRDQYEEAIASLQKYSTEEIK